MSSIIESIARGAKDKILGEPSTPGTPTIPGIQPPAVSGSAAQDERGTALVRNMALGGLALGTGTGAIVALANYLKSLQEENELEDDARLNDDTLYIDAPHHDGKTKSAAVNRWLAPGVAVTGGLLAGVGSYQLTQAVYSWLQKRRKEKMLDEAQGEALMAADAEAAAATKQAATGAEPKMNLYDLLTSVPVALPLLAAIASGGVTYSALHKAFPTIQTPKSKYPKRIRQVADTGALEATEPEPDEAVKYASQLYAEDDCEAAAQEFLMLTVSQLATEKSASVCLTSDILHKVAHDGLTGVTETYKSGGMEALVEFVKGATDVTTTQAMRAMAAAAVCKSASLRPATVALAASEFYELVPDLCAEIFSHGAEQVEKYAGIASLLHLALTRPSLLSKEAMATPAAVDLRQLLANGALPGAPGDPAITDEMMDTLTTDASGGMTDEAEGGDENVEAGENLQPNNPDPVDQFLSGGGMNSTIMNPLEHES